MNNWKRLVVMSLMVVAFGLVPKEVKADGVFRPGLIDPATGGEYLYPSTAPARGGFLVQDSGSIFRWSNTTISSTNPYTTSQIPAFPSLTAAQLLILAPSAKGQVVFCSDCANFSATKGGICVSTGTSAGAWMPATSSNTIFACQ